MAIAKFLTRIPVLLLLLTYAAPASAQYDLEVDSLALEDAPVTLKDLNASPKRALLWSIIPGGGQVYNRAWWKVPIVYGGLLGIVAVADYNQTLYSRYVTAIEQRCLGDGLIINIPFAECIPTPNEPGLAEVPTGALVRQRNSVNRNRQTAYFFIIGGYILQAVEAFTDAHLKEFDIDDDLSFRVGPVVLPDGTAGAGLSLPIGSGRHQRRQEDRLKRLSGR